tara:strand:- start:1362 stop:2189 length:828 start_codon:yes stop_codon:yes gene_type:complete
MAFADYTFYGPPSGLDIARGRQGNLSHINKFGETTNADAGVTTDLHDGANATDDVDIWVAPTQARIHAIVSTSDNDSDTGGVVAQGDGLRTLRIFGLMDWDTAETSEDIVMDGTTAVNTVNSYVIIHRMKALTKGGNAAGPNVGVITATAASDGTVTAQMGAGHGQTLMAVYGVPSTQTLFICRYSASFVGVGAAPSGAIGIQLVANPEPDADLIGFLVKDTEAVLAAGSSHFQHVFNPPFEIEGPAIVKIQAIAATGTNNASVSGGFNGILVTN